MICRSDTSHSSFPPLSFPLSLGGLAVCGAIFIYVTCQRSRPCHRSRSRHRIHEDRRRTGSACYAQSFSP